MKKKFILIIVSVLFSFFINAQDFSALWQGHFSYLNIKDVVQGNNKVYAASENAVFTYDIETLELNKISTINGLSGEFISTIHYSEAFEQLIIGYENGLIEIVFEQTDEILSVVDIIEKQTIPPDSKRINHFNEYNGLVYISTDYGISVYDLERLEFGDTFFIGNGGTQIIVSQTAVFGDDIFAACMSNSGIRTASVTNTNLIDYQEWTQIVGGNFLGIETLEDKLYTTRLNNRIYEINNNILNELFAYANTLLDLKSSNNNLVVTTSNTIFVYDSNFNLLASPTVNPNFNTEFTASVTTNEGIYIGTKDFGVLRATIVNPSGYIEIHPDGPLRNDTFSIQVGYNNVWATYGEYDLFYNPYPLNRRGFSHLNNDEWINTPFEDALGAISLNAISINPFNENQVFISSFFSGLLEVNEDIPTILHNQLNSGLESLILPSDPNYVDIRVSGTTFDRDGLLWSITSRIDRPLKSFNPNSGQWQSFDFTSLIPNGFADELGFSEIVIDVNGTKWIGGYNFGVIGFNENEGNLKSIFNEDQANLPSPFVSTLALDNRNQLWIGTIKGLRVLYNTSNFFTDDDVSTDAIIILEDGIPKELLEQQFISDIKVDGSNNKWIATIGAGLFYFSSNGQETIYHFTKDNSPLPSNNVNDVSIDNENGLVYIATDRGLLSFNSGSSLPQGDLTNAYIYPNPVRPNFNTVGDKIKIKDISENVNIKITDIEGNLVAEAESRRNLRHKGYNLEIDGGTAYWNGKNLANNSVASGVYLIMISDLDTFETRVLKLMVVR
ncbi:MAG: ABC transporter substrate-binding protein [Flavobacteriaceae bacterium]|nr:ABC transporter substrate-binding protein [Flavobacteriaceae bacterium]